MRKGLGSSSDKLHRPLTHLFSKNRTSTSQLRDSFITRSSETTDNFTAKIRTDRSVRAKKPLKPVLLLHQEHRGLEKNVVFSCSLVTSSIKIKKNDSVKLNKLHRPRCTRIHVFSLFKVMNAKAQHNNWTLRQKLQQHVEPQQVKFILLHPHTSAPTCRKLQTELDKMWIHKNTEC